MEPAVVHTRRRFRRLFFRLPFLPRQVSAGQLLQNLPLLPVPYF
jgi:hypothetical protein